MRVTLNACLVTSILAFAAPSVSPRAPTQSAPTVVTSDELDAALARDLADRGRAAAMIRDLLGRNDVSALAKGLSIDLRSAEAAVSTLDPAELETLAREAGRARADDAGGRSGSARLLSGVLLLILVVLLVLVVAEPL
jgi:hypothetical protein